MLLIPLAGYYYIGIARKVYQGNIFYRYAGKTALCLPIGMVYFYVICPLIAPTATFREKSWLYLIHSIRDPWKNDQIHKNIEYMWTKMSRTCRIIQSILPWNVFAVYGNFSVQSIISL